MIQELLPLHEANHTSSFPGSRLKNNKEKDVLMQPYKWSESYFSKPYNVAEQHL